MVRAPQDGQPTRDVMQWHCGADLSVEYERLVFTGEYMKERARGRTSMDSAAEPKE